MSNLPITDWDDAYANTIHIPGGAGYPDRWRERAARFRAEASRAGQARLGIAYGPHPRNRYDLFLPEGAAKGLVVIVHGGYWMAFDNSFSSHLASGSLAQGFAVAIPSYVLCPEARISDITGQIADAVAAAAGTVQGPLHLTGHSAGGHLVSRMIATTTPLPKAVTARIRKVVSISGLHDLRPLLKTRMNETLRLDDAEAATESPALLTPLADIDLTCWVGGDERPEFIRQSALLTNIWYGLGAKTHMMREADRHHFDVIEGLSLPDHALTKALLGLSE